MDVHEDQLSTQTFPDSPMKMSETVEEHNLKNRRRNTVETKNCYSSEKSSDSSERVPLVIMPDATKAWYDDIVPLIPDLNELQLSQNSLEKRNGLAFHENGHNSVVNSESNESVTEMASHRERMKISVIRGSIAKADLTLGELRLLGCSNEGFVNDDIRRILWPKLLRLLDKESPSIDGLDNVHTLIPNEIYQQIQKDVARSGSHVPSNTNEEEMEKFQEQLTCLICWVLYRHPELNYYQGYNDVAATVLIVMGLQEGLRILESISLEFLRRFMEKTMEKVNQELFYIFALLERVHPTLLEHLENVELFPHFALAEYTTWYAHKYAENRKLLHRLFDYFLGSPPLMPLYLSTVIVAHRAAEIFDTTPDMGHTHKVLCTLPDDLPFETLLVDAKNLYRRYPPESIVNDVTEYDHKRRRKEQEWKAKAEASRRERERQRHLKIVQAKPRIPYLRSYKTITVVTILALGLYAFLKTSSGLN